MKKTFKTILFTSIISFLFGNYIFNSYKVNANYEYAPVTIYMIEYGSYKDKNDTNNLNIGNYAIEEVNGFYKVYVGITSKEENINIISEVMKSEYDDVYLEEKVINNISFLSILSEYDNNLYNKTDDEIKNIESEIINKYKEIVMDE